MSSADIPEAFIEDVKAALENIYDFPALQRHPFAARLVPEGGQTLRRCLLDAIETLNPGTDVYFRSPHARLYNLLHFHYVESLTIQEAADELGISQRQAYRDLRKGQESIAQMLWATLAKTTTQTTAPPVSSIQAEIARLGLTIEQTDLRALLVSAMDAVQRLADAQGVALRPELPDDAVRISSARPVARQILITALSHVIQHAQPGDVTIRLAAPDDRSLQLGIAYQRAQPAHAAEDADILHELAAQLGWEITARSTMTGDLLRLSIKTDGPKLLVIDDNEGLIELFDRFLDGRACRIVPATDPLIGLQFAQEWLPDAIILDVMMPHMDGWEVLQRLRALPDLADTPVIICSVLNDPGLAYSLGANYFLAKPIDQPGVIAALQDVGVPLPSLG